MIGYVGIGTNDLARARAFYDRLFGEIGAKRTWENERGSMWTQASGPGFAVFKPFDGKPASVGNGNMVALTLESRSQVDALYQIALSLGGTDEGAPGERFPGFYGAYCRDLDGNKLCFYSEN